MVATITNGIANESNNRPFFDGAGKAALFGAISGAISFGIGNVANSLVAGGVSSFEVAVVQATLHGLSGGIMSEINGGTFASGFYAGAAGSVIGGLAGGINTKSTFWNGVVQIGSGGVAGGAASLIAGGDFWDGFRQGVITAGLNHFVHRLMDKIDPIKKSQTAKSPSMASKLHEMFDSIEEVGGAMEIGGLVAAPATGGASLGVSGVGMAFTAVGTTGNTILDLVEYKYTDDPVKLMSARNRVIKYGLTLGTGKALEKLTFNFTDKLTTKFLDVVIDKGIYTPVFPTTKPR